MLDRTQQDNAETLHGWVLHYINENCIYRVKPGDRLLDGKIPGTFYTWQFYLRRGLTNPEFLRAVTRLFWMRFEPLFEDNEFQIAGIETGATPLVAALVLTSPSCSSFIIRENQKAYGLRNRFEGIIDYGLPVLLVDDMCNSKNTLFKAVKYCREGGLSLYDCGFTLVNKDVDGTHPDHDKYIGENFKVASLFTLKDFDLSYAAYLRRYDRPPKQWQLDAVTRQAGIPAAGSG